MEPIYIFAGIMTFLIYIIIKTIQKIRKERIETIRNYFVPRGYSFEENPETYQFEDFMFDILQKGHSKKVTNLAKKEGSVFFEYQYVSGHGKNSSVNAYVMMIRDIGKTMPSFSLVKERFIHKIAAIVGYEDIDYEEFELFSKNYRLNGEDEEKVKKFFYDFVPYFEQNLTDLCIESEGTKLIIYSTFLNRKRLNSFFDEAEKIFKEFEHRIN